MSLISKIVNAFSSTSQKTGAGDNNKMAVTSKPMRETARAMASEGIVLLKNDGVLPLGQEDKVAVFGRTQYNYFCVGYGSGGDVNAAYKTSFADALKINKKINYDKSLADIYEKWCADNVPDEGYWGHWPFCFKEMPLTDEIVKRAREDNDIAIVVIGRAAGEDREQKLKEGSFYLNKGEIAMLDKVCAYFDKVVIVLNAGNVIEFDDFKAYEDKTSAFVFALQGGMESGRALCDVLCGDVNPSGRLTDTIALRYEFYPSADCFGNKKYNDYEEDIYVGYRYFETFAKNEVMYPFGFGLSYTRFEISASIERVDGGVKVYSTVKNVGERVGKTVVQIYLKAPLGVMQKPERELKAFYKTDLLQAGEEASRETFIEDYELASYDDDGLTGHKACWVLEDGNYEFYVGENVRDAEYAGSVYIAKNPIKQCSNVCARQKPISVLEKYDSLFNDEKFKGWFANVRTKLDAIKLLLSLSPDDVEKMHRRIDNYVAKEYRVKRVNEVDLKERILSNLPQEIAQNKDLKISFDDVKSGVATIEEFISTLSDEELETLCHGEGRMNSALGTQGNAGAFGGVSESLRQKGVPVAIATDGPSGIRLCQRASLLPCGSAIASSWNEELAQKLYSLIAFEMAEKGSDVLLAPGINIHRNMLCGRNFEYYSEDPYLSGKMASAVVKGIQAEGGASCVKHMACNNQEKARRINDSRVSERALREIYLKAFEICVKEANPKAIMTSYNKVNGVYSYHNYDLFTTVLRGEWGYKNLVMTDWWTNGAKNPDFKGVDDNAYRVRAQVDVLMPGGNRLNGGYDGTTLKSLKKGGLTRAELQRSAKNVLNFLLQIEKYEWEE